jgi:hypothetical protein
MADFCAPNTAVQPYEHRNDETPHGTTARPREDGPDCALVAAPNKMKSTWIVIALFAAARALPSPVRRLSSVMDDSTIRTAVTAWFDDAAAAEVTYGHISTWETGGVTDMSYLFCASNVCICPDWSYYCDNSAAASFNEDIGAWNTSGVTDMSFMFDSTYFNQDIGGWAVDRVTNMRYMFFRAFDFNRDIGDWAVDNVTDMSNMFHDASSFNQDLGGWAIDSVEDMDRMFLDAAAFDQDLGWCLDDGVSLSFESSGLFIYGAFDNTQCEWTSCGVVQPENSGDCDVPSTGNVMVNYKIRKAVTAWLSNATAAEATYGHISTWETSGVTDMSSFVPHTAREPIDPFPPAVYNPAVYNFDCAHTEEHCGITY